LIGRTISHYRVLSELGRGGMGIVYEAEDTLLGRRAALKFLPEEVAHSSDSLARFQREARAASALNHPNVCTIYEIGEQDGRWFIAMELLLGMTLEAAIGGKPVALDKLLDWAAQVAEALDVAHTHGIIHRDLKPSNIFLTENGQTKVLDFGLAKIADPTFDPGTATSPMATADLPSPLTSPGQAVGTFAFMSPEQARGEKLDARTDLFSFGTVLYQMATGRLPFDGKTSAVVFDAILNREPVPAVELNAEIPAELQRIIAKCVEKDPELRYQHASELRGDLKRLRRDTSSGQGRARSASGPRTPDQDSQARLPSAAKSASANSAAPAGAGPATARASASTRSSASAEIVAAARQHRLGFAVSSVIGLVVLAAASFGVFELLHRTERVPFQNMAIHSITAGGDSWAAAMSPDGKYVATLRRDSDGRGSLWMRHLPTNSNTEIVAPGDAAVLDLSFSPDGDYVYFRSRPPGGLILDEYRVPVLGGAPTLVVHNIDSAPSFSAGAARLCFLRNKAPENSQSLVSANPDGSDEKVIYSGSGLTYFSPAWSPDGKRIILAEQVGSVRRDLVVMDASNGQAKHFSTLPQANSQADFLSWMPDGRGLIVAYDNITLGKRQIAYVSYPGAEFHRITNDVNSYGAASLSADGKLISTVLTSRETSLDLFPTAKQTLAEPAATSLNSVYWFDWVTDDQVVLTTGEEHAVQLLTLSSSQRKSLYSGGDLQAFDVDACGPQSIVLTASATAAPEAPHVYLLDLAGGTPRQLTAGKAERYMRCTPDGKWLVYYSLADHAIHKMPVKGGPADVLIAGDRQPDNLFSITRDGKELLASVLVAGEHGDRSEFTFVAVETGQVTRRIPVEGDASAPTMTPDGQGIAFTRRERGRFNLWIQPIAGGAPFRFSDFHLSRSTSQLINAYGWSPDGKQLGITRIFYTGDVVVLQDLAK